jgi:hypothetical protein
MEEQALLNQIRKAYDDNIRHLININDMESDKIKALIRKLTYQITGNEDVLVSSKYNKQFKEILDNYFDLCERLKTSTNLNCLFEEMEEEMLFKIDDEVKEEFEDSIQNPTVKIEILNAILLGVFYTFCLTASGFDIEF